MVEKVCIIYGSFIFTNNLTNIKIMSTDICNLTLATQVTGTSEHTYVQSKRIR